MPANPPTVALDAMLWDEPTTGIGLYTRQVAKALGQLGIPVLRLGAQSSGEYPRKLRSRSLYVLAELPQVLASLRPSVFHAVGNFDLPLRRLAGTAYVLTVHDLIPLELPETVSPGFYWQFRLWLERSLRIADHVICDSDTTREQLLARFGWLDAGRLSVAHLGVDHVRPPVLDATSRAFLDSLGLPAEFLLYVGALDARKNVALVLDALERLRAWRVVPFVLVGQRWYGSGPVERRIRELRSAGHDIRTLGFQPEPLLHALMQRATLLVFPSLGEGFGLPPLEAMALGTPAVVSTAGALPEVYGQAAVQVRPDDPAGLAAALRELLLESPAQRRSRVEAGVRHAAGFRWARVAEHLAEVYRTVSGR
ncbi:MAG: glycosyltransferase family 4 protein [Myxococcaceae bacterium]